MEWVDFNRLAQLVDNDSRRIWDNSVFLERAATYHINPEDLDIIRLVYSTVDKLREAGESMDKLVDTLRERAGRAPAPSE